MSEHSVAPGDHTSEHPPLGAGQEDKDDVNVIHVHDCQVLVDGTGRVPWVIVRGDAGVRCRFSVARPPGAAVRWLRELLASRTPAQLRESTDPRVRKLGRVLQPSTSR